MIFPVDWEMLREKKRVASGGLKETKPIVD